MQKNLKMVCALILVAISTIAIVYAAIQATWPVQNAAYVSTTYGVKLVLSNDTSVEISTIDWGTMLPNSRKNSFELYDGVWFKLKNTDNTKIYVSWVNTSLPQGVTLEGWLLNTTDNTQRQWLQTEYLPIEIGSLYPDNVEFCLVIAPGTPSQSLSFTITLNACDSPTG